MGVIKSTATTSGGYFASDGVNDDYVYGDYRYIPLNEIIDSFRATYVGNGKLCENVVQQDITFHAIRALQELSYDTLRSTKDWEVTVPSTLVLVMPIDFINYIKLSWSDSNGIERIIYPTNKTSNARVPLLGTTYGGFITSNDGDADYAAPDNNNNFESATNAAFKSQTASDIGSIDADEINDQYGDLVGGRYGLDPQHAQANGTFFIDEDTGKFHFSSNLAGKTVVLRYLSDGISSTAASGIDLTTSLVPKLAEEAIYKHILYGVLSARKDTAPGTLQMIKKERFAETRKAKLRLSNIKLEELTQVLRGKSKIIKH
mgnify:CR=1 FL=1|tara:strand:+ start:640 stop:1590 length:951 start_codon:yes stop_codon:yes gene_type:complete